MSTESLEDAIQTAGNPVELLRNSQARPHTFPVRAEFSNWRSEQRAWRESCALLDQSHHMTDLFIDGPDALKLLGGLAVNSFAKFEPGKAKQYVAVNHNGYVIGDAILFYLPDGTFDLVGHPMVIDWVQFHAETGDFDVKFERDDNSIVRQDGPPKLFRYELQGPNAQAIMEKLTGEPVPDVKFFNMNPFKFAGVEMNSLRHGMAGQPGFELFGPWEDGEKVLAAILEAGEEFDLVQVGAMGYSSANLESGWVPAPFAAIFTGDEMAGYRKWLPAPKAGSVGGSFASDNVEDFYVTPYDIGLGHTVAFDHDFFGREALEQLAEDKQRTKVTLVWNSDDVTAAMGSLLGPDKAKYIALPKARYALYQVDAVLKDGKPIGQSLDCGLIANEDVFASLATIENEYAEPGTEVTVLWGEEPNSTKPQVEEHKQREIRATVAPVPYVQEVRSNYRAN